MTIARFAEDKLGSTADQDISHLIANGTYTIVTEYTVITHDPIALTEFPTISVDGTVVELGAVGSNSDYECNRISASQTIIHKRVAGNPSVNLTVEGLTYVTITQGSQSGPAPIGSAMIGSTFIIA